MAIKAIDTASIHRITSGQVVIDLQTAVKELVENSLDAGATNVEVRFKNHGLASIEVLDNGCGIQEADHESIALKHHTSKLQSYSELTAVQTFGFRGEALSSLCALCEEVTVITATSTTAPMGVVLTMDGNGRVLKKGTVARNQGTTVTLKNLFKPLPVRRKELERNIKREFGKALALLNAYALGPCATAPGIRLTVSNQPDKGVKSVPIKTVGSPSCRASVTAIWGPKGLDNIMDMDLTFEVEREKAALKVLQSSQREPISVQVKGLVSKFSVGCGRAANDRQFFYINGRPCNMNKVQKAFNEVYRSFNATQMPFIIADFVIPTESYDVNVSPDKRTILLHSEGNLVSALKAALESHFAPSRATYELSPDTQPKPGTQIQTLLTQGHISTSVRNFHRSPTAVSGDDEAEEPQSTNDSPQQLATPKISIKSSSRRATSFQPSSPNDNNSSLSIPLATQSRISEPDDSMDVDDVASHATISEDPVILDTSQTTWGKQLGMISRSQGLLSPSTRKSPEPLFLHDEDDEEADSTQLNIRKKRKSSVGAIVTSRSGDDVGAIPLPSPSVAKALSGQRNVGEDAVASPKRLSSTFDPEDPSIAPYNRAKAVPSRKSTSSQNRDFRSQLAGYARSGSQIESSQARVATIEGADLEENATDQAEDEGNDELGDDEEEDELDGSVDEETSITNSSVKKVEILKSRSPSNKSNARVDLSTHEVDPSSLGSIPPRSGHQLAIDLTSADDVDDDEAEDPTSILSQARASSSSTPHIVSRKDMINRPEIIRSENTGGDISLRFDVARIKNIWSQKSSRGQLKTSTRSEQAVPDNILADASVANTDNDQRAVEALARVIEKNDFADMNVVGQFNLGFIIVRRQKAQSPVGDSTDPAVQAMLDDLFIVDQHAADEKYNFETLQATTKIQSQKLYRPRPLELTASDEMMVIENMEILQQNGFEIDLDEDSTVCQGGRLRLTAQPISKSTVFDMKDLEEVIHLMRDRPSGQIPRCSKARAMFAMRACRKSVMVGMPLNQHQMTAVIRHMGTMDQPWNCPHGRPTMRHLLDMRQSDSRPKEGIDWSSFQ